MLDISITWSFDAVFQKKRQFLQQDMAVDPDSLGSYMCEYDCLQLCRILPGQQNVMLRYARLYNNAYYIRLQRTGAGI